MKKSLLLIMVLASQIAVSQITTDGLVAYYPFDTNTQNALPGGGAYNLLDYGTGTDISYVVNGGVTGGSINNSNCYQFNAGKSLMATNFLGLLNTSSNQSFSISYWVSYNAPLPTFTSLNTQVEAFSSLFLRGNITFGVNTSTNGAGSFDLGSNSIISVFTNTWYHMAIVFNVQQQILTVYRNNSIIGSIATSGSSIFKYNDRFVLGGGSNVDGSANISKSFSGKIDEVYVFNKALSANEVTALNARQVPTSVCPPGDVTITSQAEWDNFLTQYPNCTQINGNLSLTSGTSIPTNFSNLGSLTSVTGDLNLGPLSSSANINASGLQNITTVGGNLRINSFGNITNLNFLSGLTAVGSIEVGNELITNIQGLSNITGALPGGISISNCDALSSLNGLQNITSLGGPLSITSNQLLQNLSGLQGLSLVNNNVPNGPFSILISGNTNMTSLNGLQNLNSITASFIRGTTSGFSLENNPILNDITALGNVSNIVDRITIVNNNLLSSCAIQPVCSKLALTTVRVTISGNATGCETIPVVASVCNSLSTATIHLNTEVTCYPIPFSNEVTFEMGQYNGEVNLKVHDLSGKQLFENNYAGNKITINDLSHLPSGIYVATLTTTSGQTITRKLSK